MNEKKNAIYRRDFITGSALAGAGLIVENFNIFDFKLSERDMNEIKEPDTKESLFFDHRNPVMVKQPGSYRLQN